MCTRRTPLVMAAMVIVAILSGCARPPDKMWTKPGSSQEIFGQDLSHCMHQARTAYSETKIDPHTGISSSSGQLVDGAVFDNCMEAKGWRLVGRQTE